jgi:hypothetical protein
MRRSWRKIRRGRAPADALDVQPAELSGKSGVKKMARRAPCHFYRIDNHRSALVAPQAASYGDSSLNSDLGARTFLVVLLESNIRNFALFVTQFLQRKVPFGGIELLRCGISSQRGRISR